MSLLGPERWPGHVEQIQIGDVHGNLDDDGEVEDVVAAALSTVDRKLLEVLNVPLDGDVKVRGLFTCFPSFLKVFLCVDFSGVSFGL